MGCYAAVCNAYDLETLVDGTLVNQVESIPDPLKTKIVGEIVPPYPLLTQVLSDQQKYDDLLLKIKMHNLIEPEVVDLPRILTEIEDWISFFQLEKKMKVPDEIESV